MTASPRRQLCETKQQVKPQRVHTPGTQGEQTEENTWPGWGGPICLFQSISQQRGTALEAMPCHPSPQAKTAWITDPETFSTLPRPAEPSSVTKKFIFIVELLFLLLPSPQISLGFVSQPSAFHIFQITQKSASAAWSRFKEQSEISF